MNLDGAFDAAPWIAAFSLAALVALVAFLRHRLAGASKVERVHFIDPRRRIVEVVGDGRRYVLFLGPNNDFLIETRVDG